MYTLPLDLYKDFYNIDITKVLDKYPFKGTRWNNEKAYKLMYLRYVENKTLKQTGQEFDLSQERIRQVEATIFRKIRDYLKDNGQLA